MYNMILKCITHDFPGRVTYGKEYKVIEVNKDNYYIVGDDNKVATVAPNSFNKYFVDLVEWRERQIEKITKHTMSNLLTYNDYLVSNLETVLDYVKTNECIFNIKHLNDLITDISDQTDSSKLDFYGEQVDMIISNVTHEFGYNHRLEHKKRLC
jgi:hypothetical protein